MKRLILTLLTAVFAMMIVAQPQVRKELKNNVALSASNSRAYPIPTQQKLTPALAGKRPFYMSHIGRHGSRYQNNSRDYRYALDMLEKADSRGKLSDLGKDVMKRLRLIYADAQARLGELTPLGAQQQKEIASRMVKNFPELFEGDAMVNAHSTTALRCVFSMENTLQQFIAINPKLRISHAATLNDMRLLYYFDRDLLAKATTMKQRELYDNFCKKHACWQRVASSLFNDTTYLRESANGERLNYYLFRTAGSIQNTELRDQLTLYDLFTPEEIYENWKAENVFWFMGYGTSKFNGGVLPYSQRYLLRQLITDADSCLQLERPGVMLRFGHDTSILPLICLMDINHYGQSIDDLEQLDEKGWVNYRICPMGANIQMVFYRRDLSDSDVLVKVLLNENEATLPVKTDVAPYYHWTDVRDFYLKKLDAFEQKK